MGDVYGYGGMRPSCSNLGPAKSVEELSFGGNYDEQVRFASVKQRPYPSRRISAKEIEQRMGRQEQSPSQFQPIAIQEVLFHVLFNRKDLFVDSVSCFNWNEGTKMC